MLDHHLQRDIVYRLAFAEALRFSELQPDDIESKLFTYHLKKVVSAGFVAKNQDGTYALTPEGRRIGIDAFKDSHMGIDRAYSTLFMVVRRKSDGAWLLFRRKTHPLFGLVGLLGSVPNASEKSLETASKVTLQKTGLQAEFTVVGSGYLRMFHGEELESFTHFTLLACEAAEGDLQQLDERGGYYWATEPDFTGSDMLPNIALLAGMYRGTEPKFTERTYHL